MRRIAFLLLAAISLAVAAQAATRPRYSGTLRVTMQAAPTRLELPAAGTTADYWDTARILGMVADNLVNLDAAAQPRSGLALTWQSEMNAKRWSFSLRHGVKFHDGSAASGAVIAKILAEQHPAWIVHSAGDSVSIESDDPMPSLLAELALPRNAIIKRTTDGLPIGSGPFRVAEFQPGRKLTLAASEECWAGRPYVDTIEIELGRSLREQSIALELNKVDITEASPQLASGGRSQSSLPVELMALVFPGGTRAQDVRVRDALALAINRRPIQLGLLRGAGEGTASILPNWMTGYSSVFPTAANIQQARAVLADSRQPPLTMSYDPRDPQAQLIADRVALNAREAGITVQVSLSGTPDINLVRITLPSPEPSASLREAVRALGQAQPLGRGATVEELYAAEHGLLAGHPVIPLFHLPVASTAGPRVRGWNPDRLGQWNLADVWLEAP